MGTGAFGAHGLKSRVTPEMVAVFDTGARYQMYHALALLAAAWAAGALVLLSKGSRVNLTALALGLWAAWLAVEVFASSVPRGPSQGRGT